jgi:hypothetical protein
MARNIARDFIEGYQFADNEYDESRRHAIEDSDRQRAITHDSEIMDMRRQQHQSQMEDRQHRNIAQNERMDMTRERHNLDMSNGRQAARINQMQIEDVKRGKLKARAIEEWKASDIKGEMPSYESYEELKNNGLEKFSKWYWMDDAKRETALSLKPVLQAVAKGDIRAVNKPESIAAISQVFDDEINTGIGEVKTPLNQAIAKKELESFELVPGTNGMLAANLRITLDDGSTYTEKLTESRSARGDDPIRLFDPKEIIDESMSRYQIAASMSTPEQQAVMAKARQMVMGGEESNAGQMSPTGRTIADLVHYGISKKRAIELATLAKDNPEKAVRDFAGDIITGGLVDDPAEAMAQARAALMPTGEEPTATASNEQAQDPIAAIVAKLRENPNNDKYTDEQLRAAVLQRQGAK